MFRLINLITLFAFVSSASLNSRENDNLESNTIHKYYVNGECLLPEKLKDEIRSYEPMVEMIVDKILNRDFKGDTWKALAEMTDKFGGRLAGSQNLENTIDYMIEKFKETGLENVHTENASVLNWQRGYESATLVTPRKLVLPMLGLGTTVGTPKGGIIADVVVVESFDELAKLPDELIMGKIVLFVPKWVSYGVTVDYREYGAAAAAKKGAVAALVRSVTPNSLQHPHTGFNTYEENVKKIPAACLTAEDADMILEMYRGGENITIHLEMDDHNFPDFMSRNTIGELSGSIENSTVVIVSGHLDSWDVGVGAMDNGGGAFISWKSIEYLKKMGIRPKRTIRAVLWTGEEQGYLGAEAYYRDHAANSRNEFNIFMESDLGTFAPLGIDLTGNRDAECVLKEILPLMKTLNATQFATTSEGISDTMLWKKDGFPLTTLINQNEKYFWYHHTVDDTMDIVDSNDLDKCTALFAAISYVIADLSIEIPKDLKV